MDKSETFAQIQSCFKIYISAKFELIILNVIALVAVWSDWAEWSNCSLDGKGICSRNRTRICFSETCSSDQAVSIAIRFRVNDTEIEEEKCNYNHIACKGNFRDKREFQFVRGSLRMRIAYYNFITKRNPDVLSRSNPNKAGLFENSFFSGKKGQLDLPLAFIFQEELLQYQCNFIQ